MGVLFWNVQMLHYKVLSYHGMHLNIWQASNTLCQYHPTQYSRQLSP